MIFFSIGCYNRKRQVIYKTAYNGELKGHVKVIGRIACVVKGV